jgi:hypothetical protein
MAHRFPPRLPVQGRRPRTQRREQRAVGEIAGGVGTVGDVPGAQVLQNVAGMEFPAVLVAIRNGTEEGITLSQPCLPGSSSRRFRSAHHRGF